MGRPGERLSVAFTGGAVAAAVKNAAWWGLARHGIAEPYASAFAPHLTLTAFAPHLVWGSLWGLVFLIPLRWQSWWLRGALWSLAPAAVELFYTLPHRSGYGPMGLGLGTLAPLGVLAGALVWGLLTSLWIRLSSP